ncbi:unnamed protein product [Ceutorhynchus assimilis]|uniref:Beta-galactosidase n=1 Tax=Ceutorhynchus assimilis TaxID=467358 RepID=A0A9N9MRY2_9CUCU|nr:unnamed protein product [Ceutorhynchus assimilis]
MLRLSSIIFLVGIWTATALPTNYEYYTSDGIMSGLSANQSYFLLNGKNITIYSGSIHYFRVPRAYWQDRLRKLRALGFNTVETYIAWNLHEPEQGSYDFGDGGSELEDFLNLEEFIELAKSEDLFMIVRAGPYICAEFEFGGFPSWLLREDKLTVRSSNELYMNHVTRWFNVLLPILAKHQFTKGGPIIALQVENEFASTGGKDKKYLRELRQLMLGNGIVELLVTSDNPWRGTAGTLPELFLMTGNFNTNGTGNLNYLELYQPGKPKMAMEFWSGWFDYIAQTHQTRTLDNFRQIYTEILTYPASANIYMFIGGTNFQFLNGASNSNEKYSPVTTSYDYDAILSENGDYTVKYYAAKELLAKYNQNPATFTPDMPELVSRITYPSIPITHEIGITSILDSLPNEERSNSVSMEQLNINNGNGQSYGYIVYSKTLDLLSWSELKIVGRPNDIALILLNGKRLTGIIEFSSNLDLFGTWKRENGTIILTEQELHNATLDIIVENSGRVNGGGAYKQFKGLWQGGIEINNQPVSDWKHSALEFKKSWINRLDSWIEAYEPENELSEPKLFKSTLTITEEPKDTYINMEKWVKGIVSVNGFVLGRYAKMGPQQTLYLPAPFLKQGDNDIIVYEHYRGNDYIHFTSDPIYDLF